MHRSDQIELLAVALLKVQKEINNPVYDSENPYYSSKYVSLGAMIEHVKPIANKHGIAIVQFPRPSGYVETILLHESGQWISQEGGCAAKDLDPQAMGSAIKYSRRYGLAAAFNVEGEHDDDANLASGKKSLNMEKTPQGNSLIVTKVVSVGDHQAGHYTIYDIEFSDGLKATTFETPLAVLASELKQSQMNVEAMLEHTTRYGWKLLELRPITAPLEKIDKDDLPF